MGKERGLEAARAVAAPLVAVGFLTVIPVPLPRSLLLGPMGWAVAGFPLAGAAIGGVVAAVGLLLTPWFPPSVLAALMLAASLMVTGALHLDALMDSADGLFGGKDPAGRLTIMRDSRVGSYGIAAAGALLLTEYSSLVALSPEVRLQALAVAGALSRASMSLMLAGFPPASPRGLAAGLKPQIRGYHVVVAALLAAAIAVPLLGTIGVVAAAASGLLILLAGRLAMVRLGGITGDICGGLGLLVEATVLLICVAGVTP